MAQSPARSKPQFRFHAVTPDRWPDLETLFGERGACSGCWCMFWRLPRAEFDASKGEKNRRTLKKLVAKRPPGILAYDGAEPIGWCAVAPRHDYYRLVIHRTLKPVDDQPVWSITCLFVKKEYRRQGVSSALIVAAAKWAKSQGATIVEAYPTEPKEDLPAPFIFAGTTAMFTRASFKEVKRPSKTRAIVRREL